MVRTHHGPPPAFTVSTQSSFGDDRPTGARSVPKRASRLLPFGGRMCVRLRLAAKCSRPQRSVCFLADHLAETLAADSGEAGLASCIETRLDSQHSSINPAQLSCPILPAPTNEAGPVRLCGTRCLACSRASRNGRARDARGLRQCSAQCRLRSFPTGNLYRWKSLGSTTRRIGPACRSEKVAIAILLVRLRAQAAADRDERRPRVAAPLRRC